MYGILLKCKKQITSLFYEGFCREWSLHFLQHFGRRNGLDYETNGVGHKKCGEFRCIHFPVRFIGWIEKDKEQDELQKTASHKNKSDLGLESVSIPINTNINDGCRQKVYDIGKYDFIAIF